MTVPDQIIKSERIVLGAALASEAFAWTMRTRGMRPDMFVDPFHRDVLGAIYGLMDGGRVVSPNLVASRLPIQSGVPVQVRLALMISTNSEEDGAAFDEADGVRDRFRDRRAEEIGIEYLKALKDRDGPIDTALMGVIDAATDLVAGGEAKDRRLSKIVTRVRTKARRAFTKSDSVGISTGLASLDQIIGDLMPGRLTVIGGGPGAGKSALGHQILHKCASERGGALYFQRDMGEADVVNRGLSMMSGFSVRQIEHGEFDQFEYEQLGRAEVDLSAIDMELDTEATTIEDISAIATAKKKSGGLSCILVDHLRKYGTRRKVKDKWEAYQAVTGGLKDLCVKLDVPAILLSQITRTSLRRDNPIPEMQDLDGGGSLEQDADTVLMLFNRNRWILREKLNGERPTGETEKSKWVDAYWSTLGRVDVYLPKHRLAQPDTRCELKFIGKESRFADI